MTEPAFWVMTSCLIVAAVLGLYWAFFHLMGPVRFSDKRYFLFRGRFLVQARMDGEAEWGDFCQIPKVWQPSHAIHIAEQSHLRAMVGTPAIVCDTRLVDLLNGRVTRIWTDAVIRRMYEQLHNSV